MFFRISGQSGGKAILAALLMVFSWGATAAIAGVNENLIDAAGRGDLPSVKRLINKGAAVNAKDKDGWTALMDASFGAGHREVVELLLAHGADVNAKNNNGDTALSLASQNGHEDIEELLLKAGAK